jgi:hypothetical protein
MIVYILENLYGASGNAVPGLYATREELRGWDEWRSETVCTKFGVFR